MSKIVPVDLVESMSGSLCSHSPFYFFRKNGRTFSARICNPYKGEPTANQTAQRAKFSQARAAVKALTPEQKAAYAETFKNQRKFATLQGYIFAMEYAKLGD